MSTRLLISHLRQRAETYAVAMFVLLVCVNNPLSAVAAEANASEKPNILLIVADDLGYADVGFHGGKEIPTPHIDSIATGGVQFTNGYVTCPVCSPTRAGILTGRYQQRFGHEFNPGGGDHKNSETLGLPLSESTIADALRDAGYRTAVIGKWHLGGDFKRHPLRRGFDHFYGFLGGAHPYIFTGKGGGAGGQIYRDDFRIEVSSHLTTEFGKKAATYVSDKSEKPFFLYLAFNAVHRPLQPDEERRARFTKIQDPQRRSYAALLSGLDDAIGNVLRALKESGKFEDTLVFFLSDNGGPQDKNGSDNTPLSGDKGTVLEGGIRVPFAVQWQGYLPAGKRIDAPVHSLDIPATVAAAAGAKFGSDEKKIDGINLIPYITGDAEGDPHDSLFWRFGTQRAIRQGNHKLCQQGDGPPQLFNLVNDIGEKKDISSEHPELVKKLNATYAEWNSELAEPLWKAGKLSEK